MPALEVSRPNIDRLHSLRRRLRKRRSLFALVNGGEDSRMTRKITYWVSTGLLAAMSVFAAFAYLSGSPEAVQGFAHVGYPQQLRIILGIAKLLGAITLVVPSLPKLKEWAYAGFTFAWISAFVAHYLAKDGPKAFLPLILLLLLAISYVTRPTDRQWHPRVTTV
jgi:uncharacterized membrane protein YphA (DoxX/SURF4 family)